MRATTFISAVASGTVNQHIKKCVYFYGQGRHTPLSGVHLYKPITEKIPLPGVPFNGVPVKHAQWRCLNQPKLVSCSLGWASTLLVASKLINYYHCFHDGPMIVIEKNINFFTQYLCNYWAHTSKNEIILQQCCIE